ncbi:MAG: aldo/keto reductase [Anaerolineae bacterium]|nr:aldo/keto reductase [Anaerolineae bacterium]
MEYRTLGRTGLEVSVVGLGTEYLNGQSRENVVSVIREAIDRGVNYIDLVFSFPDYLNNLSEALRGRREQVILTGHLGSTERNGQYRKTRSPKQSEQAFREFLARLDTDYVDILFLHNCDKQKDYDQLTKPRGQMELAQRLRQAGQARFIGFSGHTVSTALQAIESGVVDVLMLPVNLAANAVPGKKDLLKACVAHNVGVVAMKPFAGGKLLQKQRTVRMSGYQMGGQSLNLKKSAPITPVQCLAYVLAQVGVCTTVPGCANLEQLDAALAYRQATEAEKDFSSLLADFQQYVAGECVYCNHCLPCPERIDIGQTIRLLEMAQRQLTAELQAEYEALPAKASACEECGVCVERCPFGVEVTAKMRQAVALFEGAH